MRLEKAVRWAAEGSTTSSPFSAIEEGVRAVGGIAAGQSGQHGHAAGAGEHGDVAGAAAAEQGEPAAVAPIDVEELAGADLVGEQDGAERRGLRYAIAGEDAGDPVANVAGIGIAGRRVGVGVGAGGAAEGDGGGPGGGGRGALADQLLGRFGQGPVAEDAELDLQIPCGLAGRRGGDEVFQFTARLS